MRVLIAPDSFKGSLSAPAAAAHMAAGLRAVFPEAVCDPAPLADGGEGTAEILALAAGGRLVSEESLDPLGRPLKAAWALLDESSAVVDCAAASGLPLLVKSRDERDPARACTYGTGVLIRAALRALHASGGGEKRLIIGLGGSAANDGGAGALRALGLRFLDASGRDLPPGGAALARLASIDTRSLDPLLARTRILLAVDVDSPLTGPEGATAVFGPQKGVAPEQVEALDAALAVFARVAAQAGGRDLAALPGAGAAGGLAAGLLFFSGASLRPGVELVLEAVNFRARARQADVILCGEGRTDAQSARGKVVAGVAREALALSRPLLVVSGSLGPGAERLYGLGVTALASAADGPRSLPDSLREAGPLLERAVERVFRALAAGMRLGRSSEKPGP